MKIWMALAVILLAAGGCSGQAVQCTAASAQEPVVTIVKDELEKAILRKVRNEDGGRSVSLSKIRAAIAQIVIAIDDIRTSKEDPNSTKRFCTGTLKLRFAADLLADADQARETADLGSVSDLADRADIERRADSFTTSLDFNVQPTDDGSKVFAETETGTNMFGFASELIASALLRASVEESKRQEQVQIDQASAAQTAALGEQKAANLASAKTDNQIALQTINATWRTLSSDTRAQLLPVQRAWIRKKDADCRVEAASASIDPTDIEVARMTCDTRVTQERTSWLQPYRSQDAVVDDAAMNEM